MSEPERRVVSEAPLQTARPIGLMEAVAAMSTDDAVKLLERTHPLYDANRISWQKWGDVALNRVNTIAERKRYLMKGKSEQDRTYDERVALSAFMPETPSLTSDFIGAVFAKGARREFREGMKAEIQSRVEAFRDDTDADNRPIADVMKTAAEMALIFGSVDYMLDHPAGEETETPYMVMYTPDNRLDWELDNRGLYRWVKYRETRSTQESWSGKRKEIEEYRIVIAPGEDTSPGRVLYFRVEEEGGRKKIVEQSEIPYAFGTIPIRTLYWRKDAHGIGIPWVSMLVEGDIHIFRQESDLIYDLFLHNHPFLLAWLYRDPAHPEKNPLTDINIGGQWGTILAPADTLAGREAERLEYVASMTSDMMTSMQMIQDARKSLRRLAGNGSSFEVGDAGNPQSGVALAYQQAERSKNFVQLARNLQDFEWQITELVATEGYAGEIDLKATLEIAYPDQFDQRLTGELDADLKSAKEIGSPTLVSEVKKMLAARLLGDGVTADTIATVMEEIEGMDEEQEPVADADDTVDIEGVNNTPGEPGDGVEPTDKGKEG
jgi:hypothetical protein